MKRLITGIITAFLTLTPAFAADEKPPTDLTGLSKEILTRGLNTLGVCAATDIFAIQRYTKFYDANKDDTTALGSDADKAITEATTLTGDLESEVSLMGRFAHALRDKGMEEDAIEKDVLDLMTTTDTGLADKYGKIGNVDEFTTQYKKAEDNCVAAFESFIDDIKSQHHSIEQ